MSRRDFIVADTRDIRIPSKDKQKETNKDYAIYGGIAFAASILGYYAYKKWVNPKIDLTILTDKPNIEYTKELLYKNHELYHMEYSGYFTNHLAHALIVLCYLGASKEKLQDFYDKYTKNLVVIPDKLGLEITKENFRQYEGHSEAYHDLLIFFKKQLAEDGVEKVLEYYMPFISKGLVGGAFHGIIQLGFVMEKEIGDLDQISTGLAYSVMVHQDVGEITETINKEIPSIDIVVNILHDLGQQKDLLEAINKDKFPKFIDRVVAIQKNSSLLSKIAQYDLNVEDTPENIQKMMNTMMKIAYMIGVNHFFIIHLVTSFRALKNIFYFMKKHCNNQINSSLINNYWRSALLAYVSLGCPFLFISRPLEEEKYDWESIIKDVFPRDVDEHVLKLIYVAKEENDESLHSNRFHGLDENFYFNFAKKCSEIKGWIF